MFQGTPTALRDAPGSPTATPCAKPCPLYQPIASDRLKALKQADVAASVGKVRSDGQRPRSACRRGGRHCKPDRRGARPEPGPQRRPVPADRGESLPDDELEQIVAARKDRQRLLDTDREFVLIMTEGALRWHVGSPAVMIAQLQHLAEATRHRNVRLGVIPWTRPVRAGAIHGFHLYDRRTAIVGTETATAIITDARDI